MLFFNPQTVGNIDRQHQFSCSAKKGDVVAYDLNINDSAIFDAMSPSSRALQSLVLLLQGRFQDSLDVL